MISFHDETHFDEFFKSFVAFSASCKSLPRRIARLHELFNGRGELVCSGKSRDRFLFKLRKRHGAELIVEERLPMEQGKRGRTISSPMTVAYWRISSWGVFLHSQGKKVKQVTEVALPIRLRVGRKGRSLRACSRAIPISMRCW